MFDIHIRFINHPHESIFEGIWI